MNAEDSQDDGMKQQEIQWVKRKVRCYRSVFPQVFYKIGLYFGYSFSMAVGDKMELLFSHKDRVRRPYETVSPNEGSQGIWIQTVTSS